MPYKSKQALRLGLLTTAAVLLCTVVAYAGQGYYVLDKSIRSGMLVSLTKNTQVVEPANEENASALLGVVGSTEADVAVNQDQVVVQTDGEVNTLVSTVSGDIKVGDHIGVSPVLGFGAKRDKGWAVGIAQTSLHANSKGAVKSVVTDSQGAKHEVYVANIPVRIHVVYIGTQQQTETKAIPSKIQALADSLAGKRASQVAIILGFLLLLAGFIIAGIIVNAAVRNGMQAISRQPLAKQEINSRTLQSFAIALGILVSATVGALVIVRVL